MRLLFLIMMIASTAGLSAQSKVFLFKFESLIKDEQPEKAEQLLNRHIKSINQNRLNKLRIAVADSYYKNFLFDKALKLYKLSDNLKKNRSLKYYEMALRRPEAKSEIRRNQISISPEWIKKKRKLFKKTRIPEAYTRYLLTFNGDPEKTREFISQYRKLLQERFDEFMRRRRPDRAEKYLLHNFRFTKESIVKEFSHKLGLAFMKSYEYRDYNKAVKYIADADKLNEYPSLKFYKKAMQHMKSGEFYKALDYFRRGGFSKHTAWMHGELGLKQKKAGNILKAKANYKRAIDIYHNILFTMDTPWYMVDSIRRINYYNALSNLPKGPEEKQDEILMSRILLGCGNYCSTLNDFSIFYYCRENINEITRYSMLYKIEEQLPYVQQGKKVLKPARDKNHKMVYDYQIIKEQGDTSETRAALQRTKRTYNNRWATESIQVTNFFFGPVGLLHSDMQHLYNYRLHNKNGQCEGINAWIVDIVPLYPGKTRAEDNKKLMYGRVWIDKRDYSVIKISWIPKFCDRADTITFVSNIIDSSPVIKLTSVFNIKKGVLRYPSSGYYTEYFIDKEGKKQELVTVDIKFSKYRYFNTATELRKTGMIH